MIQDGLPRIGGWPTVWALKRKRLFSGVYERLALLLRAKGRCQKCGEVLDKWEADHIVPFSKGGETVLENGQALCPGCNRRKGAKMEGEEQKQRQWVRFGAKSVWIQRFKDISGDLLRSGQTKSVRTILDLIRTGERPDGSKANALSVVLPTRCGKSDVIRLLSLYSRDIGVGASLVLSPSDFLKSQIVSANKVSDMASRLGFSNLLSSGFGELKNRKELGGHSLVNLVLGSSTIQMVGASAMIEPDQSHPQRHSLLRQSMEQLAINSGGKVLVMIDEAHECGDGMVRGRMVE